MLPLAVISFVASTDASFVHAFENYGFQTKSAEVIVLADCALCSVDLQDFFLYPSSFCIAELRWSSEKAQTVIIQASRGDIVRIPPECRGGLPRTLGSCQ